MCPPFAGCFGAFWKKNYFREKYLGCFFCKCNEGVLNLVVKVKKNLLVCTHLEECELTEQKNRQLKICTTVATQPEATTLLQQFIKNNYLFE